MPISEKMRERRKKYIGSSDVPAILGISKFSNAADIWLSKTQTIDDDEDVTGAGSPASVGTYLEEGILEWGMDQIRDTVYSGDVSVTKNQFRVLPGTNHSANCDAILSVDSIPTAVFEIKSTGDTTDWGRPMTGEIPDAVNAQVQWQMHITGLEHAWVACLMSNQFGGMTFALYTVGRDQPLIDMIVDVVDEFWTEHVEKDVMPEGQVPRLDSLKKVRRLGEVSTLEGDRSEVFDDMCREFEEIKKEASLADKRFKSAKAELLAFIGDAEGCQSAGYMLSYAPSYRKEYTVNATEIRTFRLKKRKD